MSQHRFDPLSPDVLNLAQSGRHEIRRGALSVRPFPYPFVAGMAFANGILGYSAPLFEELYGFISGRKATRHGDGLGLEIGGTMWLRSGQSHAFGLSENPTAPETARAIALARSGWLDTLSGTGDTILRGIELCERHGIAAPVAVQNGGDAALPSSQDAVRYWSDDRLLETDKFGEYSDYRQPDRLRGAMEAYNWEQWSDSARALGGGGDQPIELFNRIILPSSASHGAHAFKRYRGHLQPTATTFPVQVTSARLDELQATGGAVVLEAQFGLWSLIGRQERPRPIAGDILDDHAIACWRDIAERTVSGQLFVTTLSRLLSFLWLREHLVYSVAREAERWTVQLDGVADASGKTRALTPADLNGLSFLVPSTAPEVIVSTSLASNALDMQRTSDPRAMGMDAVYRPWTALEFPHE
jgi:hypothetical protein